MKIVQTTITLWYDHLSYRYFDEGKHEAMIWENGLGANMEVYCDNDSALKQFRDCQGGGGGGGHEEGKEVVSVK